MKTLNRGEERGVRKSHVLDPVTRRMSKNDERGGTPKRTPNLEKPS
jgi:hypothetical protein